MINIAGITHTTQTLKRFFIILMDIYIHFSDKLPSTTDIQKKCMQTDTQYNLTTVNCIFQYLVQCFNNILSSETQRILDTATPVLQVVVLLIVCVLLLICFCWLLVFIFGFLPLCIPSFVIALLSSVSYYVMFLLSPVSFVVSFIIGSISYISSMILSMYSSVSAIVSYLLWFVNVIWFPVSYILDLLSWCFGWKVSTVKMMKAPGNPTVKIVRGVFEANPTKYFRNLRGK